MVTVENEIYKIRVSDKVQNVRHHIPNRKNKGKFLLSMSSTHKERHQVVGRLIVQSRGPLLLLEMRRENVRHHVWR
jgi:hypothetical protein